MNPFYELEVAGDRIRWLRWVVPAVWLLVLSALWFGPAVLWSVLVAASVWLSVSLVNAYDRKARAWGVAIPFVEQARTEAGEVIEPSKTREWLEGLGDES